MFLDTLTGRVLRMCRWTDYDSVAGNRKESVEKYQQVIQRFYRIRLASSVYHTYSIAFAAVLSLAQTNEKQIVSAHK